MSRLQAAFKRLSLQWPPNSWLTLASDVATAVAVKPTSKLHGFDTV